MNKPVMEAFFCKTMERGNQRDLFSAALRTMILRTFERQHAVVQRIKRTSSDFLQIEEGSLYPTLQRLKEASAKAEWGISFYKSTSLGVKHLEREVSSFEKTLEGITRVLAPGES